MDKDKALRIAEELSEAHVASTCTIPDMKGEWVVEIWSVILTHEDFRSLMRVCEEEEVELSYEDQSGEEGSFYLRSAVKVDEGLAPWKDPANIPRGRIGRGA